MSSIDWYSIAARGAGLQRPPLAIVCPAAEPTRTIGEAEYNRLKGCEALAAALCVELQERDNAQLWHIGAAEEADRFALARMREVAEVWGMYSPPASDADQLEIEHEFDEADMRQEYRETMGKMWAEDGGA